MATVGERITDFLKTNRSGFLEHWMQQVLIDQSDGFKHLIEANGDHMLDLVIACVNDELEQTQIRELAYKVSAERLKAETNISNFIYNVSIGRSVIFDQISKCGIGIDETYPILHSLNGMFDQFLYFAVHHYTELKNQLISKQSLFIERTHSDKMTILGQMSSSFVHEFRNPLTSVIGFVQLLKGMYPTLEYIDVISKELDQLKFRITQFLLLSKKDVKRAERESFQIASIFDETLEFLYPMIVSSNVSIERDIDDSVHLLGYRDEFRQVLINIIMNSLDALSTCAVKEIYIKAYIGDDHLAISISNNGPPISKDMIGTIFEPFVSGKKLGTGIGLYLCRNIIKDHGGAIECESDETLTTFRITIPVESTKSPD